MLRTALVGSTGLAAAYLVGCGDESEKSQATATASETRGPNGGPTATETSTAAPVSLSWRQVPTPAVAPPPRRDHSLVTGDVLGGRLYLFGGRGADTFGDLWTYDIAANSWAEVTLSSGPPVRFGHNAVFEQAIPRMFVFGGQAGSFFNDVWTYDVARGFWFQVDTGVVAPAARYGAASAIDPSGRLIVSHGFTDAGRFDDSWSLAIDPEGEAWTDISPQGARPIERCLMRGVWDTAAGRFLMFGGQTNGQPFLGDLWALEQDGWREIAAEPKPSPRNFYALAFDSEGKRAILFGGNTQDGPSNQLWFLDSASETWSQAAPEGDAPSPRQGHDAVWIAARRKLFVFGGRDESGDLNDLWELTVPA